MSALFPWQVPAKTCPNLRAWLAATNGLWKTGRCDGADYLAVLLLGLQEAFAADTLLAAQAFLVARIAYAVLYHAGLSWIRAASWMIGVPGIRPNNPGGNVAATAGGPTGPPPRRAVQIRTTHRGRDSLTLSGE